MFMYPHEADAPFLCSSPDPCTPDSLNVCGHVLSTPASQSNGAAPSGRNTWARLFDLSGDECAPEMVSMCVR